MDKEMRFLGKQTSEPTGELDTFEWGIDQAPPTVTFETTEFTHICPVTGQPDFGKLTIEYQPLEVLVETKSLKLYLFGFRDRRSFDEMLVVEIAQDLFNQLRPSWVEVRGEFKSRGGIALTAVKRIDRKEEQDVDT